MTVNVVLLVVGATIAGLAAWSGIRILREPGQRPLPRLQRLLVRAAPFLSFGICAMAVGTGWPPLVAAAAYSLAPVMLLLVVAYAVTAAMLWRETEAARLRDLEVGPPSRPRERTFLLPALGAWLLLTAIAVSVVFPWMFLSIAPASSPAGESPYTTPVLVSVAAAGVVAAAWAGWRYWRRRVELREWTTLVKGIEWREGEAFGRGAAASAEGEMR